MGRAFPKAVIGCIHSRMKISNKEMFWIWPSLKTPPERQKKKTCRAKTKNSHLAEAGWEKADHDVSQT